ncbi:MAG: 3-hydroxybutyryl-CoA dehydrogenase [Alphaproteobacteria bacterium]|nr:3-hydroxybutyryl-CoA dehydrogenase [Alphaproteobacteria bacterium]
MSTVLQTNHFKNEATITPLPIHTIGVIGAGQMGTGIAHVCAQNNYQVQIIDTNPNQLNKVLTAIGLNLDRQIKKNIIKQDQKESILEKIKIHSQLNSLSKCDLVIEAATENPEVKSKILKEVCSILPEHSIIATNTSSISITKLAAVTQRPEKFIGMHFMNPVPIMQLIEVIRGLGTDEKTFITITHVAEKLGKTLAIAEDFPGFIVNRILLPMINEAVYTLHEGVGSVESIDTAMKLGTNQPMGPLELADFIGLDTCLSIMKVLYEGLADSKYRPCPLLVKYVEAGWLGRKTKKGFYDYSTDRPTPTK